MRRRNLNSTLTFRLRTSPQTAGSGDYSDKPLEITFQPGETGPKSIDIDLVDDKILEDTEQFTVYLVPSTPGVTAGKPAAVRIIDNEGNSYLLIFGAHYSYVAKYELEKQSILNKKSKKLTFPYNGKSGFKF